ALGRVRAGALVQDGLDRGQRAIGHTGAEFVLVEVVRNGAVSQVDELVALGQVVDRADVDDAAGVPALDALAAEGSRSSGNDDHACNSSGVMTDVPSFPTTMPAARLAQRMAACQSRPAARITAMVASTVSPAPDTSNTSCACASVWSRPPAVYSVMPCSE